jgi:KipI family sensor histidine kinase inhibitor
MRWRPAGDAALLLQAEGVAARLAAAILAERVAGVLDVIPGAGTVLVTTEPGVLDLGQLAGRLLALPLPPAGQDEAPLTEIPVEYDGPDLAEVAELTGLSAGEVVARHVAGEYTVGWLGFSPGFGYLTGLDQVLATVPRLAEPRLRVPAGAVAIAGGLAAVYPAASPGGWRLLGRTTAVLWDPDRDPPAVLAPGMRVRFRAAGPAAAAPAPAAAAHPDPPATLATPARDRPGTPATHTPAATPVAEQPGDFHDRGGLTTNTVANQPRSWNGPTIEVIRPGPLATVQDLGRPGFGHLGVPYAGAADAASLQLANRLVGNPDGAAGLELTLGRAALRFPAGAWVAVTGAPAPVTLEPGPPEAPGGAAVPESPGGEQAEAAAAGHEPEGAAAGHEPEGAAAGHEPGNAVARDVPHGIAFRVPAGGMVRVGAPPAGLRCYLAVRGGVDVPPVLGSRSADLRSGLGPAPLRPGGLLPVGDLQATTDAEAWAGTPPTAVPAAGQAAVLRVIPGPRDDWFAPGALQQLCEAVYLVTPASDRTGLRLDGPELPRARVEELLSEGVATGALQVPHGGRPILLLADHPVTGGYPVIATVVSADIGLAGQLRPGSRVRFTLASSR